MSIIKIACTFISVSILSFIIFKIIIKNYSNKIENSINNKGDGNINQISSGNITNRDIKAK